MCHVTMRHTRQFHIKTTTLEERLGVVPIVQSYVPPQVVRLGRCSAPNANGPPATPNAHSVDPTSPRRRVRKELGASVQRRPRSKQPRHQHKKINGDRPPSAFRRKERSKPIHVAPNHQTGIIPTHLTSTHAFYLKISARMASNPGKRTNKWNSCVRKKTASCRFTVGGCRSQSRDANALDRNDA